MAGLPPQALADRVVDRLLATTGPRPHILVAYSGGLDSTALSHMLIARRRRLGGLRLAHVDHGLQSASRDWGAFCRGQARRWKVPFVCVTAAVETRGGESLEAAARDARYEALASVLRPGEILVTAQHRDDQVETLLLQLFRGCGVPGLAAMPYEAPFSGTRMLRPLLPFPRAELAHYALRKRLTWVEDPTNQGDRFDRGFLRNEIMPLLRKRWPGVGVAINRTSRHMAEAAKLLDAMALADLQSAMDGPALSAAALRARPRSRRKNLLRSFISKAGVPLPSEAKLLEIVGPLLAARPDAQPEVTWPGATLRRRAGRLELVSHAENLADASAKSFPKSWSWTEEREFRLNPGSLAFVDDPSGPVDLDRLPAVLTLRARSGGEKLRPSPRGRSQSLKKLLQAAKLTIEERACLPLLFAGVGPKGHLIAAGDRWLDASVHANVKSRRRARLVWTRASEI